MNDEKVSFTYFNLLKRLVPAIPRRVVKAKSFSCPLELQAGLAQLEQKIVNGEDISPHLSRRIRELGYNDGLLNHWGIHHLHLGTTLDAEGYITRTRHVLFSRFDSDNAYFINVLAHGVWASQEFVSILHHNWPASISRFRLPNVIGLEIPLSDSNMSELRRGNVVTPVEVEEGVVYGPIGGGFSSNGLSSDVVRQADYMKRRLRDFETAVISNVDEIRSAAREAGVSLPEPLLFKLHIEDNVAYAVESRGELCIKIGTVFDEPG
jgi:hypothetical protein